MADFEEHPDWREYSPREIKLPAPQAGIFESPTVSLCINEKWAAFVHGVISVLEGGQYWLGDSAEIERIEQEIYKLQMALGGVLGSACGGGFPTEGETCNEYDTDSFVISYAPNDPHQTPDFTPSGYTNPPWRTWDNELVQLLGGQSGDVYVDLGSINPVPPTGFMNPVEFFENLLDGLGIIMSGLPRFQIRMNGAGVARLHLLAVPFGGQAFISVDNNPVTVIDTYTVTPTSAGDLSEFLELFLGAITTDDNLIEPRLVELEIEGEGEHEIDVTFIPMFSLDGDIGWGGGLRKVVLCNEELTGVSNLMPQFRVNQETLSIEWKPTEFHPEYESIGQVIYPVHMQVEPDPITSVPKIQWTLQPIPIGGGSSPFEDWLDLVNIEAGENGLSIELRENGGYVQWSPVGANDWENLFPVPQNGEDGETPPLPELRVSGGYIQWSPLGANDWTNLTPVPSDGVDGITPSFEWVGNVLKIDTDGDNIPDIDSPVLKGDPADCGCDESPASDLTETNSNRCGKALYLQNFVWTVYGEIRTQVEAAVATADTVLAVIGAIPAIGWTFEGVYDAVVSIAELGSFTLLDLQDTLANREALQQAWYCLLDESDQLNDAQYDAIHDAITTTLPSPLAETILAAFNSVSRAEMKRRAWLGAKAGGDCSGFDCGDPPSGCENAFIEGGYLYAVNKSSAHLSYQAENAFDGDVIDTRWHAFGDVPPHWISPQLTEPIALRYWKIYVFTWLLSEAPRDFLIQGSNNFADWTTIGSITDAVYIGGLLDIDTFNEDAYTYYRIYVTDTDTGYCSIAEIEACQGE